MLFKKPLFLRPNKINKSSHKIIIIFSFYNFKIYWIIIEYYWIIFADSLKLDVEEEIEIINETAIFETPNVVTDFADAFKNIESSSSNFWLYLFII